MFYDTPNLNCNGRGFVQTRGRVFFRAGGDVIVCTVCSTNYDVHPHVSFVLFVRVCARRLISARAFYNRTFA